jgi:hypothetical protein
MINIPFQTIDWEQCEKVQYPGETGFAIWQTMQFDGIRLRLVEYSANYKADHWCEKGHIIHCLEGEFTSELATGESFRLIAGTTYIVSDKMSVHRSVTSTGAKLFIVDGDFLKFQMEE